MSKLLKYSVLAVALALGSSTHAHAATATAVDGGLLGTLWGILFPPNPNPNPNQTAPEIDPSLAMGAFALVGGTLTVLRSRRSSRPETN